MVADVDELIARSASCKSRAHRIASGRRLESTAGALAGGAK